MDELQNIKSPFKKGGMFDQAHPLIFEKAKSLRKNMTDAEKVLWSYLKIGIDGLKFRRQHPLGLYIADFYCHPVKLVIKLDGGIHEREDIKLLDQQREKDMKQWGYVVVRFKNEAVFQDTNKVLFTIKTKVEELQKDKQSSDA